MSEESPRQIEETSGEQEPKEVSSEELFEGYTRLVIVHRGEKYRLMITRNGKLILQK